MTVQTKIKIVVVCASPRKRSSRTLALARRVCEGICCTGVETEVIHLADRRIGFCRHCEMCHRRILQCPVQDNAMAIARKILDADGIVFATPNYINQVTGMLKTLFDRHSHFIHCKRLMGKYTAAVVTSGSGYDIPVVRYLEYYSNICGAQFSGAVTARQDIAGRAFARARALGKKLVADIVRKRRYPAQMKRISESLRHFSRIIPLHKKDWNEEYVYWQDKGWIA